MSGPTGRAWWAAILLGLALLLILPVIGGAYTLRVATLIFMWAALAGSWNLVAGYAGSIDLGPVVYYGIGAFTTGILMLRGRMPFLVSLGIAGLLAVLVAYPVGTVTLRLRGAYFAIGTLALAESVRQLGLVWDRFTGIPITGGSAGISLPLSADYVVFYYLMLLQMLLAMGTAAWLERSKFGYGLKAIGQNDRLAAASGVDPHRLKRQIYLLSALFTAWTGGIAAYWLSYVNASDVFGSAMTFQIVVMTLVGGLATPLGPVVGAGFLTIVSELLGTRFVYHYLIAIGVIIVLISLGAPAGLAGLVGDLRRRAWGR